MFSLFVKKNSRRRNSPVNSYSSEANTELGAPKSLIRKRLKLVLFALAMIFLFISSTYAMSIVRIPDSFFLGSIAVLLAVTVAFVFTKSRANKKESIQENEPIISAFDQMVEAIFISDPAGKIIKVNQAACKLLDFADHELIGKSLQQFMVDPKSSGMEKCGTEPTFGKSEYVLVKKEKEHFFAEVWRQTLDDGRILEIVRDVSEQKAESHRAEDLLEELKYERDLFEEQSAELVVLSGQLEVSERIQKELNAEKDKFFSIIAHDLKSPFAGIMGYSTLLLEEFDELSKQEMKDFIGSLDKLSKNTFKLIENLLDWSRLQTGKMKCAPIKLQLYESVLYATSLVSANAERKEIKILNKINEVPFIKADERMLNSVLENFLSNAIKFTPRGGSITISSAQVNIFHEVTIADTGVGMSPEVLEKIFRIDSNYTTLGTEHEKGTGLGVILCKEMLERQGGAVKIESEVGVGTQFKFILPMWIDPEQIQTPDDQ